LFVLLKEEKYSEPMLGDYTFEKAKEFIEMKALDLKKKNIVYVKENDSLTTPEGFILFVADNCTQCPMALFAVQRAA